jgi:Zn finger protein HypA/HybF involved in hydrogenase expression
LAARRAQREAILKKIASEEEKYPASGTFKYNEDLYNMEGEVDYPSMTLEGSEGNSLKEQNPSWAEQKVPTNNVDSLQFPDVTKPMKFEGSGDGSLEYTVDWDSLETPSEGMEDVNMFDVPTQMPSMPHKTTVPQARVASYGMEAEAEKFAVQCTTCGKTMRMTEAEMNSEDTKCPNCEGEESVEEDKEEVKSDVQVRPMGQYVDIKTSAALDTARIKTAYSCSSKLALAGIIESSDIDSYAEQMLNDELKADAMIRQTKLLLSAAQASTERVAAAAAERMSVRTASTNGISTSPAFTGSSAANSASLDIQGALRGTWTMPTIED